MNQWIWSSASEYYLEDSGKSEKGRQLLAPRGGGGFWSCSKETRAGDLVMLHRIGSAHGVEYKDLAYLLQATSDAIGVGANGNFGWSYGCEFRPLAKFKNPVSLADLRKDAIVGDWSALKGNFQGRSRQVPDDVWRRLIALAKKRNPGVAEPVRKAKARARDLSKDTERQIQSALAGKLYKLRTHGFDVELFKDPDLEGRSGFEYPCAGAGTRIDVLCRYKKRPKRFLVIEVKKVRAKPADLGQIEGYMEWVEANLRAPARGLIVSRGATPAFEDSRSKFGKQIQRIDVPDLHLPGILN